MNNRASIASAIAAGTASGGAWSLLPMVFDSGWAIPDGLIGQILTVVCGALTGAGVTAAVLPLFKRSIWLSVLSAAATLPLAILVFSGCLTATRLAIGVRFDPPPAQGDFALIVQSYFIYGLFGSGFVLFPLAVINQTAIHLLWRRIAQPARPDNAG